MPSFILCGFGAAAKARISSGFAARCFRPCQGQLLLGAEAPTAPLKQAVRHCVRCGYPHRCPPQTRVWAGSACRLSIRSNRPAGSGLGGDAGGGCPAPRLKLAGAKIVVQDGAAQGVGFVGGRIRRCARPAAASASSSGRDAGVRGGLILLMGVVPGGELRQGPGQLLRGAGFRRGETLHPPVWGCRCPQNSGRLPGGGWGQWFCSHTQLAASARSSRVFSRVPSRSKIMVRIKRADFLSFIHIPITAGQASASRMGMPAHPDADPPRQSESEVGALGQGGPGILAVLQGQGGPGQPDHVQPAAPAGRRRSAAPAGARRPPARYPARPPPSSRPQAA